MLCGWVYPYIHCTVQSSTLHYYAFVFSTLTRISICFYSMFARDKRNDYSCSDKRLGVRVVLCAVFSWWVWESCNGQSAQWSLLPLQTQLEKVNIVPFGAIHIDCTEGEWKYSISMAEYRLTLLEES